MMLTAFLAAALAGQPVPAVRTPPTTRLESTAAPAILPDTGSDEFRLSTTADDRLTVAVSLGTHGPFRFLVDTGADRTVVSEQLATRLDLPAGIGVRLHSVTGMSQVRTATVKGLRIAARDLPDVTAPLLDADHVKADGILGTDVLRSAQVRFDFKAGLLSISTAPKRERKISDPDTIVVQGRRRAGRLIVTEAEIDGQRLTIVLDTGSEISIGNSALRKALGKRGVLRDDKSIELMSVTGEKLNAYYMFADRLQIGGLTLTELGIAFADAHTFMVMDLERRPALLLGMNALKAFDSVTIDLGAKKLRFTLRDLGGRGSAARYVR